MIGKSKLISPEAGLSQHPPPPPPPATAPDTLYLPHQSFTPYQAPQRSYAQRPPAALQVPKGYKLKRNRRWPWVVLGLLVILVVASAVGANKDKAEDKGTSAAAPGGSLVASDSGTGTQQVADSNLTTSQESAVRSARSYLDFSGFSRQGLIDQLSSEFGDQYPVEDATVAVDSLLVDWNAQAVRSANSYLEISGFSCQGLIDQLASEFGDQYTVDQATWAATQVGLC